MYSCLIMTSEGERKIYSLTHLSISIHAHTFRNLNNHPFIRFLIHLLFQSFTRSFISITPRIIIKPTPITRSLMIIPFVRIMSLFPKTWLLKTKDTSEIIIVKSISFGSLMILWSSLDNGTE